MSVNKSVQFKIIIIFSEGVDEGFCNLEQVQGLIMISAAWSKQKDKSRSQQPGVNTRINQDLSNLK